MSRGIRGSFGVLSKYHNRTGTLSPLGTWPDFEWRVRGNVQKTCLQDHLHQRQRPVDLCRLPGADEVEDALLSHPRVDDVVVRDNVNTCSRSGSVRTQRIAVVVAPVGSREEFAGWLDARSCQGVPTNWRFVDRIERGVLNEDEMQRILDRENIMSILDTYGTNRTLHLNDFAEVCRAYRISEKSKDVQRIFDSFDNESSGWLDYSKFKKFVKNYLY